MKTNYIVVQQQAQQNTAIITETQKIADKEQETMLKQKLEQMEKLVETTKMAVKEKEDLLKKQAADERIRAKVRQMKQRSGKKCCS